MRSEVFIKLITCDPVIVQSPIFELRVKIGCLNHPILVSCHASDSPTSKVSDSKVTKSQREDCDLTSSSKEVPLLS
jgi:hypothetical protein